MSDFPKWFLNWVEDLKREELYEIIFNRMSDEDKEECQADFDGDEEDEKMIQCAGNYCKEMIVKEDSYYLHFPDGTEEWYCEDCQSDLRQSYIRKADYRGHGDGEIFAAEEE